MRPESRQSGFALVAAMFLIVVIALVIATMAGLSSVQHGTNSLAIQQARAYQAARAGLEWGIARAANAGACASGSPALSGGDLAGFVVSVSCTSDSYDDGGGGTVQIFRIIAEAGNGDPSSRYDYAFRRLSAVVEK